MILTRTSAGWQSRSMIALLVALITLTLGDHASSQGLPADYDRAEQLPALVRDKVFRDRIQPHWFANNDRFWYRVDLGSGHREFVVVNAVEGTKGPAFDHAKLAEALLKVDPLTPVEAEKLPVDRIEIADDGSIRFEVVGKDKAWRFDPHAGTLEPADPLPAVSSDDAEDRPGRRRNAGGRPRTPPPTEIDSPDGKWTAFHQGEQLYLREKATKEESLIRAEAHKKDGWNQGVYWSPDSTKIIVVRVIKGDDRKVNLIASSPDDQLQPKLSSYDYLKPGDQVDIDRPYLYDVVKHESIDIADPLFNNPWSLDQIRWSDDSKRFTFLFNERGHQTLRVVAVDATTGVPTALIDEKSPTFIDYSNKTYFEFTKDGSEILWMSERSGWNHLYLIDAATGAVKNPITQGEWLIKSVDRVDHDQRQVWLQVMGLNPGEDPYHVHYVRVNFDGSNLVRLTEGDGNHRLRFSPDRRFAIDTYSRVDLAPITELRRVDDGHLVLGLEHADTSALTTAGIAPPERFVAKGRDGSTDIHGIIIRPTHFDRARKYPVIEAIYAGPQGAFVPKTFVPLPRNQTLAELGFIVVQIDGMGTNWRSKAFHDVCSKNLADAGFPDRILWMKAAAQHEPAMDLERVGIFGGSAGGQNALGAMLFHPEFYKAAVADCGCHDNRMDKIWWNEAWMGWPIGPHYAEQSNVTNAHKLTGALMLTVGELDHNVDPASTMQVVNALIAADKDFDLIVFPGKDHGAGGGPYGERRRRDFFVQHLLNVAPPVRNLASTVSGDFATPDRTYPLAACAASSVEERDQGGDLIDP